MACQIELATLRKMLCRMFGSVEHGSNYLDLLDLSE
jgi:hypothetical protein